MDSLMTWNQGQFLTFVFLYTLYIYQSLPSLQLQQTNNIALINTDSVGIL